MKNYDKLNLGRTLNSHNQTPTSDDCHNYGSVSGCDEHCPVLIDGDCEIYKNVNEFIKESEV